MSNKYKIIFFILSIVIISSCKSKYGSTDFAESMGQSQRIRVYFRMYHEKFSRSPSGEQLREFILNDEYDYKYQIVQGWVFYEEGATYIAAKRNIQNQQGSYKDIFILTNNDFSIVNSAK